MMLSSTGVEANFKAKVRGEDGPLVILDLVNIAVNPTIEAIAQLMGKNAKNVEGKITSKLCVGQMKEEEIIEITVNLDKRKAKGKIP